MVILILFAGIIAGMSATTLALLLTEISVFGALLLYPVAGLLAAVGMAALQPTVKLFVRFRNDEDARSSSTVVRTG